MEWPNGIPFIDSKKVQRASRNARYDMLLEQCREKELKTLLYGHHADDQAGE